MQRRKFSREFQFKAVRLVKDRGVAAVVDLFPRRVVGRTMRAKMTAQLVTDALIMAIWRGGRPDSLLTSCSRGAAWL